MKIVILGAGQVGTSVAESLCSEANDITVVDLDPNLLGPLQDRLDLRGVVGNAASPSVLREAGMDDADLLIAVTQSDQINLCACRIAKTVFNTPTRIARLRSTDFIEYPELLDDDNFAVDFSICPEQEVTEALIKLIEFPEALQVLQFAHGMLTMVAMRAFSGGPLVGRPIRELRHRLPTVDARVVALFCKHQAVLPEGDTVIEDGDEIFLLAATHTIREVMVELKRMEKPVRTVMIAGGGNIGFRLAKAIEGRYQVKIIQRDGRRAEWLAANLEEALVLQGDATDEKLLGAESIDEMDVFLALTNDDEDNIMATLLAKRLGARRVLALINRKAYVDLLQGGEIDIAISPAQVSIGSLLAHVRRGDVASVHSLRRGAAEALELIAHGDVKSSKVVGRRLEQIDFPKGVTVGAIVRKCTEASSANEDGVAVRDQTDQVLIAHHDTVIEQGDHVIVFCVQKHLVRKVEKLFQVAVGFL